MLFNIIFLAENNAFEQIKYSLLLKLPLTWFVEQRTNYPSYPITNDDFSVYNNGWAMGYST